MTTKNRPHQIPHPTKHTNTQSIKPTQEPNQLNKSLLPTVIIQTNTDYQRVTYPAQLTKHQKLQSSPSTKSGPQKKSQPLLHQLKKQLDLKLSINKFNICLQYNNDQPQQKQIDLLIKNQQFDLQYKFILIHHQIDFF